MNMAPQFGDAASRADGKARPRLAIACVADTKHKYLFEALRLAHALWMNPELRDFADLYIGVFPGAARQFSAFIRLFRDLGATIVWLGERSDDHGPSNKLQILEAPALQSYDYVSLVDCDMIPVRSFPELLDFDGVQAKPADLNTLDCSQLAPVFDLLALEMPEARWQTSLDNIATTCYCNTGCIIFSRSIFREFVIRWNEFNDKLRSNKSLLKERVYFLDQASFCACLSTFIDRYRPLPLSMNFPGHMPIDHYPAEALRVEPKWLHYHNKADYWTGALDLTVLSNVQSTVANFNEQSASFRQALNATPLFWDVFYGAHIEPNYSRERPPEICGLVRCVVDSVRPESVLDLGCGTFGPQSLRPSVNYHGVDFSVEAINISRRKFPQHVFELKDIRSIDDRTKADLVMMLDVIGPTLHPLDKNLVRRISTWAQKAVLVSAKAPDLETRDQVWRALLDQLVDVSPAFREVGHVGTELFVLNTN